MTARLILGGLLSTIALAGAACGGTDSGSSDQTLTVYSGREEEYVESVYADFEDTTGIDLEVRYGDSAELAAQILEEGDGSPADVFFAQDAGSLGAVGEAGLLTRLDDRFLARVDDRFRSSEGVWVGTSGRARVAAYNTDSLTEADLPDSIEGFTDPRWKGRIGFPPTNSSFQSFVAAMIISEGEDATRRFLEGLVANEPELYEDNGATTRAIASGVIDVGLINHYYVFEVSQEEGDIPVALHYFEGGDPGSLVNTAGVGILETSDSDGSAEEFVDYVMSQEAQTHFAQNIGEYPLVDGVKTVDGLVPLDDIEAPNVDLSDLGGALEPALHLMAEVGLL